MCVCVCVVRRAGGGSQNEKNNTRASVVGCCDIGVRVTRENAESTEHKRTGQDIHNARRAPQIQGTNRPETDTQHTKILRDEKKTKRHRNAPRQKRHVCRASQKKKKHTRSGPARVRSTNLPTRQPTCTRTYLEDTLRPVLSAVRTQTSQGRVKLQERRQSTVLHGGTGGGAIDVWAEAAAKTKQQDQNDLLWYVHIIRHEEQRKNILGLGAAFVNLVHVRVRKTTSMRTRHGSSDEQHLRQRSRCVRVHACIRLVTWVMGHLHVTRRPR